MSKVPSSAPRSYTVTMHVKISILYRPEDKQEKLECQGLLSVIQYGAGTYNNTAPVLMACRASYAHTQTKGLQPWLLCSTSAATPITTILLIQKCLCKLLLIASLKSSSTAIPAGQNRKCTTEKWDLRDKVSRRKKYRNAFRTANNVFACFEGIFNFRIIYAPEQY